MGISYIGYLNYIILLFLASGLILLALDVTHYKGDHFKKEKKVALWSAWINISFGAVMIVGNWIFKHYYW